MHGAMLKAEPMDLAPALLPNHFTTLGVDVSPDGRNWTDVSTSSGSAIPFLNSRGAPYEDDFSADQSATYTASAIAGFSTLASWNVDTPQRRVQATGGVHALFSPNDETLGDGGKLKAARDLGIAPADTVARLQ